MLLPKFLSRKIFPEKSLYFLSQKSVLRPGRPRNENFSTRSSQEVLTARTRHDNHLFPHWWLSYNKLFYLSHEKGRKCVTRYGPCHSAFYCGEGLLQRSLRHGRHQYDSIPITASSTRCRIPSVGDVVA